jgi:allantoinase
VLFEDGIRPATIRFEGAKIVELSQEVAEFDFGDLVILPGLVDTHVHVNEPGRTNWEGFETATRAAAAGGTTTIVDMPLNSIPPTVTVRALETKLAATTGKLSVDVAFWGGLIPGSESQVAGLVAAGARGFKSFLVDSGVPEFPQMTLDELGSITPRLRELGVPLLVHAEDAGFLHELVPGSRDYLQYLASRPVESERSAVAAVARLAIDGTRVHVLHISSPDAAAEISRGPDNLTGETCPHYLIFAAEDIGAGATAFKCAPPIRDREDQEGLWEALVSGALSMVVSDHSPAPPDLKEIESGDFSRAWGGIGSLQLRLPAVWTGAADRGIPLERLGGWLATEPALLAGLSQKGRIDVGMDADLVVFDPDGTVSVVGKELEHRHPTTPYDGMTLQGAVIATILRGQAIYEDGQVKPGSGRTLTQ